MSKNEMCVFITLFNASTFTRGLTSRIQAGGLRKFILVQNLSKTSVVLFVGEPERNWTHQLFSSYISIYTSLSFWQPFLFKWDSVWWQWWNKLNITKEKLLFLGLYIEGPAFLVFKLSSKQWTQNRNIWVWQTKSRQPNRMNHIHQIPKQKRQRMNYEPYSSSSVECQITLSSP